MAGMSTTQYALFCCADCQHTWTDELPPMQTGRLLWPCCPKCSGEVHLSRLLVDYDVLWLERQG